MREAKRLGEKLGKATLVYNSSARKILTLSSQLLLLLWEQASNILCFIDGLLGLLQKQETAIDQMR